MFAIQNLFERYRMVWRDNLFLLLILILLYVVSCSQPTSKSKKDPSVRKTTGVCAHNVSSSVCFICDATHRDPKRLWCKEHNAYEDRCFLCHPEIQDKSRLYCKEHSLYEDECFICHPEIGAASIRGDSSSSSPMQDIKKSKDLLCVEHDLLEKECALCHVDELAKKSAGEGMMLRLKSKESIRKAGIETRKVSLADENGGPEYPCVIRYNENLLSKSISPLAGTVSNVRVDVGSKVKRGETLIEINAGELIAIQSELEIIKNELEVKKNAFIREREMFSKGISTTVQFEIVESEYEKAQSSFAALKQKLATFGVSENDIEQTTTRSTSALRIRAPFSGIVVEKQAVPGQYVDAHTPLCIVTDLSTMWAEVSLKPRLVASISIGDSILLKAEESSVKVYNGIITWIEASIDSVSRTVKVRAEINNADGMLRNGEYAKVVLSKNDGVKKFVVFADAVQRIDNREYVFVKTDSDDLFEIRVIDTAFQQGEFVQIADGLKGDELVVITGAFALKSELLRSRFGAGCCEPLE